MSRRLNATSNGLSGIVKSQPVLKASASRGASVRLRSVDLTSLRRALKREVQRRQDIQKSLASSRRRYDELLERSARMEEHLRRLSHEILSAQEEERKRISRELHDEIGQILTAVNVKLAALRVESANNTTGIETKIAVTQRLVERSMNSVHQFARQLRPPLLDDLGLIPALRSSMKEFTKRTRVPIQFTAFAEVERLSSEKRTVLFRVVQEALINVDKHARARSVRLSIVKLRGTARMDIHDDGRSFSVERKLTAVRIQGLGLLGMRERVEMVGGRFTVESAPGKGTTVRAEIPFGESRPRSMRAPKGSRS